MKTIEEKAKAYDGALEDMRVIYPNLKGDAKLAVEHAFPQLRESDDEKIRKFICSIIDNLEPKDFIGVKKMNVLEWLEKQEGFLKDGVGHYFYDGNTDDEIYDKLGLAIMVFLKGLAKEVEED